MKSLLEGGGQVMRIAVITAGVYLSLIGSCVAQTSTAAMTRIETRIPPQALGSALKEFAQGRGMQVLFLAADVKAVKTRGAFGDLTADETLARLLSGTGLKYRYVDTNAVSIVPASPQVSLAEKRALHIPRLRQSGSTQVNRRPVSNDAAPPKTQRHTIGPPDPPAAHRKETLSEVVVTGSRLAATSTDGPQDVQTYDLDTIGKSGQPSLGTFLSTLPAVSVAADDEAQGGYASTVQLRGLPSGTTLVLLNGLRLENSGFTEGAFFNLDYIPIEAVEKIEVDPNGSSAIYGSDAIAGVVNIILKKDFNGVAADAGYEWAKGFGRVRTSVAAGRQWQRGGISVFGSFGIDGGLLASERLLSASNDYSAYGGPDSNNPICFPGNVFSTDGTPLPGAPAGSGASYAAVTGSTSTGRPPFSQFTYGTLNECSSYATRSILPSRHRAGILVEGHLDITPDVELFGELIYAHVSQTTDLGDESLFGTSDYQSFTVSAANPNNPFGEAVGVALAFPSIQMTEEPTTDFFRPVVGIKGTLARRWQWKLTAWQSTDWTRAVYGDLLPNQSAIQDALNSPNPMTALNPFVNGPPEPQNGLQSLFGNIDAKFMGRDRSAEASIRGPLIRLPGGTIDAVIGGDDAQSTLYENFIYNGVGGTPSTFRRKRWAVFAEAEIPLIGSLGREHSDFLTVTAAGRHDDYSDFGSANTEQFGLQLRPTDDLLVRGSYATAFDAPTLQSVYGAQQSSPGALLTDPTTGALENVNVISGGNPSLRPTTGHSRSIGVVYSSGALPGLLVSVTQWSITEDNLVQELIPQIIVDNAMSFPGRVVQNAAGQIVEVNDTALNFGSIDVSGLDYNLHYSRRVGYGLLSVNLNSSETYRYRQGLLPGAQPVESVSQAEDDGNWAPRWKGTVTLGWKERSLSLQLDGRYVGSYSEYDSTRRIGNFWNFDTNIRWAVTQAKGETQWFGDAYLEGGATNMFNRAPQFSNYDFDVAGYDAAQTSIVGRLLYVRIGTRW